MRVEGVALSECYFLSAVIAARIVMLWARGSSLLMSVVSHNTVVTSAMPQSRISTWALFLFRISAFLFSTVGSSFGEESLKGGLLFPFGKIAIRNVFICSKSHW